MLIYDKNIWKLYQYCSDEPALNNFRNVFDFVANNSTDSFKCKAKITGSTSADGSTKYVGLTVSLKYSSNF